MIAEQRLIYVNSTLVAERTHSANGVISPFHWWGYVPEARDVVLGHGNTMPEFLVRSQLRGLDARVLLMTTAALRRGYDRMYLVTQPDLLWAIPILKKRWPTFRVVTWLWTDWELLLNFTEYASCDHLFCLTDTALQACRQTGLGGKASLELLGGDPEYFVRPSSRPKHDVALIGRSGRDEDILQGAMSMVRFNICTTRKLEGVGSVIPVVRYVAPRHTDVIDLLAKSAVSWVLLRPKERHPTGYTNTIESLLTGTAVVLSDSAIFPGKILELPGVFLYSAGSRASLIEATTRALHEAAQPGYRATIRNEAAKRLDGVQLTRAIRQVLGAA